MAETGTSETDASVEAFIAAVENPTRRGDGFCILEIMRRETGIEPRMWGPSIVGFGSYHYRYDSGREGDMFLIGFSPRKANLTLYLSIDDEQLREMLPRLGKHKTSVACLYINKLADVDMAVLEEMIRRSWEASEERHGVSS
jgi:hypothetical protein